MTGKKLRLRRDDRCTGCGAELSVGTIAHWMAAERIVRCEACYSEWVGGERAGEAVGVDVHSKTSPVPVPVPMSSSVPVPVPVLEAGLVPLDDRTPADIAGASAQRTYDRRSQRELARKERLVAEDAAQRQALKEQRPVIGRIVSALTPKPQITPESQSTAAWKVGAEGERRVAEVLAETAGITVLHDRLVPESRANIDHLVVGPSGVFVIDAKKYTGKVEARDVGGLFRTDVRLYVNERNRTKLVDGVLYQVGVVRAALGDDFADVEVRGVLCFVGCEWGWIMRTKRVRGVTALWPNALPEHVSTPGDLGDRIALVADRLRSELRPAR